MYHHLYSTDKDVRKAVFSYTEAYLVYGSVLVDLERIEEAQAVLRKGLKWNPVSFSLNSEYIETFKMLGRIDEFYELSKKAIKLAYRPKNLARCYRNLGYYFVEKERYSEALGCYRFSNVYDKDAKQSQSEMYYILGMTDGKVKEHSIEEFKNYSKLYDFPLGVDNDIMGLSLCYGEDFLKKGHKEAAKYLYQIAYDMVNDEKLKKHS